MSPRVATVAAAGVMYAGWAIGAPAFGFVLAALVLGVFSLSVKVLSPPPRPVFRQARRTYWVAGLSIPIGPFFAGIYRRFR